MGKWEGKASTTLTKARADQIWSLFLDLFNIHQWFPNMATCYGVHGMNGEVGCIRYCGGFSLDNEGVREGNWARERLVAVDPNMMCLSYQILESSFGLTSYLSTVKVVADDVGAEGCVVEWSFSVDPIQGLTCEYLIDRYKDILNQMTNKMELVLVDKSDA